jgi:hypothetical protein
MDSRYICKIRLFATNFKVSKIQTLKHYISVDSRYVSFNLFFPCSLIDALSIHQKRLFQTELSIE